MNGKFLKGAKDGALQVYKAFADYLAAQAKLSAAQKEQAAAQIQKINKQNMQAKLWPDYNNVANAFFNSLVNHHSQCGLCRPHNIEDIYCNDLDAAIDIDPNIGEGSQVVFSFEANRMISDLYLGGMRKHEYPKVPVEDIEKTLKEVLPKYARLRGYGYADMQATNGKGDTVIVTLRGVHRWGYYTGDLLL